MSQKLWNYMNYHLNDNIIITGATGLLGSQFKTTLMRSGLTVKELSKTQLDLSSGAKKIRTIIESYQSNTLIHCAAFTNVDACEVDKDKCFEVNTFLPEILASICNSLNMKFVFISSTGIYGEHSNKPYKESDKPLPTTWHHQSKLKAEELVRSVCPNHLIVRTGWLFGGAPKLRKNFVFRRIDEAKENSGTMYSDETQIGNPTFVNDVVDRVLQLTSDDLVGTFNCVNEGCATRLDYVREIILLAGLSNQVTVIASPQKFERIASVSKNESASNYKMNLLGYPKMRNWKYALKEYLLTVREV